MTEDTNPRRIDREAGSDQPGQFLRDVGVHAVVPRPRRLGRVHIETGAAAEVVTIRLARQIKARGLVSGVTMAMPSSAATRCAPALTMKFSSVQVSPESQ